MTILSVVKDVCAVVGVSLPGSLFSNIGSNRTMQEMVALSNEIAQRIAYDLRDWVKLRTTVTFNGNGVTTQFAMPANYKRMLLTANVWRSTSTQQPMRFIADSDEWLRRRAANDSDAWGEWTLLGDFMHIWPAMGAGVSAYFAYMDRNCVTLNAGGYGETFVNDGDRYRLDERLLKLGMIWQWKAQKGSPYAEDMGTYSDALAVAMGKDQPAPIIADRAPLSSSVRASVSAPMPVGWGPQP